MKTFFSVAIIGGIFAVILGPVAAEKAAPPPPKEIAGYRKWKRVNPKPLRLPDLTALDCAAPGQPNPHRQYWFTVFVNKKGEKGMLHAKSPVYPVGTTIVKEKLNEESSMTPATRTVMTKREKGFDPKVGDWEFFVVGLKGGVTRDTIIRDGVRSLAHCRSCHQKVKTNDYVFRTYLPKPAPLKRTL